MLSVLLLLAGAQAAEFKSAGKVAISAVSEVPLYSAVNAEDAGWYVEATLGEKPLLLRLATEQEGLLLWESAATRAGLKVGGPEGKRTARVEGLQIGEARFSGITARIGRGSELGVDGAIGLAAFADLAWAVEPARGTVKLGPSGAGSVAASVGTLVPFTQAPERTQRVGKQKVSLSATPLVVEVRVSGVAVPAQLQSGQNSTSVIREVEEAPWFSVRGFPIAPVAFPAVEGAVRGEGETEWRELAVGGITAWTSVARFGMGFSAPFVPPARVGQDVLGRGSLGVDAGQHVVALAPAGDSAAVSYAERLGARLKAAAEEPAPAGQDADAAKAALVGKLSPWVDFLMATDQAGAAVAPARQVAEARPELCTGWHAYGNAQLATGDAAGAVVSLTRAGELYQAWAKLPLAERTERAGNEAVHSKSADFDGVYAQNHSCHTAWGDLARAQLVAGNPGAVSALYPRYLDLDAGLPLAAGSALLQLGDKAAAEAAFRQAVQLSLLAESDARGGMMLATRERSTKLALAQVDAVAPARRDELRFLHVWAELLRAQGGSAAVVAGMREHLTHNPGSAAAWLVLAREEAAAGTASVEALAAADAVITARAALTPRSGVVQALRAEHLRLSGKLAEAEAAAERATTLAPSEASGWYVRSLVAEQGGNAERAADARRRASAAGVADPLYASLVKGT